MEPIVGVGYEMTPKYRYFRLQRTTNIAIVSVFGAMVILNILPYPQGQLARGIFPPVSFSAQFIARGWPITYYIEEARMSANYRFDGEGLSLDVITALAAVTMTGYTLEWFISRKRRRTCLENAQDKSWVSSAWFQLHLMTCIVLMLLAGVLLWANCQPEVLVSRGSTHRSYGWPKEAIDTQQSGGTWGWGWNNQNIIANFSVAIMAFFLCAAVIEALIHSRVVLKATNLAQTNKGNKDEASRVVQDTAVPPLSPPASHKTQKADRKDQDAKNGGSPREFDK